MELGHWSKLHIYFLSSPGSRNWAYFRSIGSSFRDKARCSNLPYFDMKLGHWSKFHNLHMYSLSLSKPRGGGGQIELIFALRAAVSDICANFQIWHIPSWHFVIGHSCTYILRLFQPWRARNWANFRSSGSGFWVCADFLGKVPDVALVLSLSLSTPGGSKLRLFLLYGQWFPR